MKSQTARSTPVYLICILLSTGIFLLDLVFPLGVAAGVPYVAVVLLARWLDRQSVVVFTTAGVTVLTIIGFFIPFPEGPLIRIAVENRLIALFAIWTTAVFSILLIRRNEVIRQERDFNKSLVETASAIILLVDADGAVVYYNPFTAAITGRELAETQRRDWIDVLVPESEKAHVRRVFASYFDGQAGQDAMFSLRTSQQEPRQFSWTSQVLTQQEGQVDRVLLIGQDMTPLVEAQQRLVQSERLAAIGQTVASLSHEVRNELHSLQLALLLLDKHVSDVAARKVFERLPEIGRRLTRLFEDIRGFAAPIHLERSMVSIMEIWRRAWADAAGRHGGQAEMVEEAACQEIPLSLDALRVEQVFRNLFDNSLAVCHSPARVTVSCCTALRDGKSFLRVSVRDNGPGFSSEAKKRVFEPFFTTKSAGTGLGLPICKRIVEAHGGDLELSKSQVGAEFLIFFPLET